MIITKHLNLFENHLRNLNLFKEEEIEYLCQIVKPKKFQKNEFFIKEGEKCEELLFVTKGIFRSYYSPNSNTILTHGFTFENNFLTSVSSFNTENVSEESIQAILNSEGLIISKSDLSFFEKNHLGWNKFLRLNSETQLFNLERSIRRIYQEDAETGYKKLIENQPHFFKHLPLNQIASYLGITQRHLSRIRKGIMMKERTPVLN